jgi:2-succinyl-5-enolpyruvyl-6-hydroxy-3-cyclohexene-1-carboxylate synthase
LGASGARQVAVDAHGRWFDADRTAAHVLHADPTAVATALARLVGEGRQPDWAGRWAAAESAAAGAIASALDARSDPTDPGVARVVAEACRARSDGAPNLVVASSMPVRDLEWFGGALGGVRVLANRGANGIDGVVSTAVGVALAARGTGVPTVALVGDLAFLHDANALLGLAGRGVDLTVVVVDNDGGAIFSFLPPGRELAPERFELLFGTPHGVDLAALTAAHGVPVSSPATAPEVRAAVDAALDAGGPHVVRVRTDRATNVAVHDELNAAVATALAALHL